MEAPAGGLRRGELALLLGIGLLLLGSGIGLKDPWPPDEPRFTLVAAEMLASGDYLFPRRAGELYPDKPPVFLWIQAALLAATGSVRLAHQLPSLLASLGTLLLVSDLGSRLWGGRVGLWAGLALLAIVQFPLQAHSGQIDATLCLFTTCALYGLARHLLLGPSWGWYLGAFAAMGAGVLTKGVGVLPVLMLVPWAWARWRRWPRLPAFRGGWRWAWGPVVLLAVVAAWAVPMSLAAAGDPDLEAYRTEILWRQTAERYVDPWGHHRPAWYYVTRVIPTLWLPATLMLPWLFPRWREGLRLRDPRLFLLLGWLVLVVLFFSASPGKRGVYLLPAVPALALACAPFVAELWRSPAAQKAAFGLASTLAAVFATGAVVAALGHLPMAGSLGELGRLVPLVAGVAALVVAAPLLAGPRHGLGGLLGALAAGWLAMGWWAYPLLDPMRSGRALMRGVDRALPAQAELAIVDWREQLVLQSRSPVTHFGYLSPVEAQLADGVSWLQAGGERWLLLPESAAGSCFDRDALRDLGVAHRQRWLLAPRGALAPGCEAGLGSNSRPGRVFHSPGRGVVAARMLEPP